jgi:hypothetical protein
LTDSYFQLPSTFEENDQRCFDNCKAKKENGQWTSNALSSQEEHIVHFAFGTPNTSVIVLCPKCVSTTVLRNWKYSSTAVVLRSTSYYSTTEVLQTDYCSTTVQQYVVRSNTFTFHARVKIIHRSTTTNSTVLQVLYSYYCSNSYCSTSTTLCCSTRVRDSHP